MNNRINFDKWQSVFLSQVDLIKDDQLKIDLLKKRVVELERQNRRFKLKLAGSKDSVEDEPIKTQSGKDFYSSLRWRKLRFNFLHTNKRECIYCGSTRRLHVDHIKPRSLYPDLALDEKNLQILCDNCNLGKSNKVL